MEVTVRHSLPGRLRIHLSNWQAAEREVIEAAIGRGRGISSVRANALTGNLLVRYDTAVTDEEAVVQIIRSVLPRAHHAPGATTGLPWTGSRKPELSVRGGEKLPDPLRVVMPTLHLVYAGSPVGVAMHLGEIAWYWAGRRERRQVAVPVLHLLLHDTPLGLALHVAELTWAVAPFMPGLRLAR